MQQPAVYRNATRRPWLSRRLGSDRSGSRGFACILHHIDRPVGRLTGGPTGPMTALTVAMLTSTGACRGQPRTLPVLGFASDDGFVEIASNYGQPTGPASYRNLRADPRARPLVEGVTRAVVAELLTGERREQICATLVSLYPGWGVCRSRVPDRDMGCSHHGC